MAFNPRGFWRVAVVLFGVCVLLDAAVVGKQEWEASGCRSDQATAIALHRQWAKVPPCTPLPPGAVPRGGFPGLPEGAIPEDARVPRCDQGEVVLEPTIPECRSAGIATGYGLLAAIACGIVVFGTAFTVRWVYRGFTAPTA